MRFNQREYNARRFIERNVDLIEQDNWSEFFIVLWRVYASTAQEVIKQLRDADIVWDEDARQLVLFDGINETMKQQIAEDISITDLYRRTSPSFAPNSWLGYSMDDFYDLVVNNMDKIPDCKLNGSILELGV